MKSISMRLGEDSVTVTYRASKDFDNTGDYWEIEWDDVSVMYRGIDITDIMTDGGWDLVERAIRIDLI